MTYYKETPIYYDGTKPVYKYGHLFWMDDYIRDREAEIKERMLKLSHDNPKLYRKLYYDPIDRNIRLLKRQISESWRTNQDAHPFDIAKRIETRKKHCGRHQLNMHLEKIDREIYG